MHTDLETEMKHNEKHTEVLKQFDDLPDDAGIAIPVWMVLSGRSRASTYRDIAAGKLEAFYIGHSRRLRAGSCRRLLKVENAPTAEQRALERYYRKFGVDSPKPDTHHTEKRNGITTITLGNADGVLAKFRVVGSHLSLLEEEK
jgi:hypothetical protein